MDMQDSLPFVSAAAEESDADNGAADVPAAGKKARSHSRSLDQFYTRPEVVARCMQAIRDHLPIDEIELWLEPSAGTGAFFSQLPYPRIGLDIDETHRGEGVEIIRDFLAWPYHDLPKRVATVGNPPFGRNSSLALRFVNRAAEFSEWVCMILPRTFEKAAMQAKVSDQLELVEGAGFILDPYSFIHEDEPYDVPCCFQIWRRAETVSRRRTHKPEMTHSDFSFVKAKDSPDFAFQRVGAKAGLASRDGLERSWKSNHYIKVSEGVDADELMAQLNSIDWEPIRSNTAGNPSISKGEMIAALSRIRPSRPRPKENDLFG